MVLAREDEVAQLEDLAAVSVPFILMRPGDVVKAKIGENGLGRVSWPNWHRWRLGMIQHMMTGDWLWRKE